MTIFFNFPGACQLTYHYQIVQLLLASMSTSIPRPCSVSSFLEYPTSLARIWSRQSKSNWANSHITFMTLQALDEGVSHQGREMYSDFHLWSSRNPKVTGQSWYRYLYPSPWSYSKDLSTWIFPSCHQYSPH